MLLLTILFTIIHITSSQSPSNCSALQAFVEVSGEGLDNKTLVSAQALFPPHSYYVPWTELVLLSTADDICHPNSTLTSDITNKIVLLFEEIGDCSAQYKVLAAQNNGATAVLMSNADLTGTVVNIPDDNDLKDADPTIPMRSISKLDAELLSDEITAGTVYIQIGCFDTTYPTTLCLSDSEGSYSSLAGNYQRQEQQTVNGHPIWKNPGYSDYRRHLHIFLHDEHGDGDWFWAITYDETFKYDSWMQLICAVRGKDISDPSLCPEWLGSDDWGETWDPVPAVNVSIDLCPVPVGEELITLCVDSLQHTVAGIRGTYTLTAAGSPRWLRTLTDCDQRAGTVAFIANGYYGKGYFVVYEPLNQWIISLCMIPQDLSENGTYATMKWRPDLCTEWVTRNDYDLSYSQHHRYPDSTYNISLGECSAERAAVHGPPCVAVELSDIICLSNNSVIHGSLMGEFALLSDNITLPYYDSPIYERVDYYNPFSNETAPLYIWYANEFYAAVYDVDDYLFGGRDWILTRYSLEQALEEKTYFEYGHCSGWSYGNPASCQGWVFYAGDSHHYDEEMSITEGECAIELVPSIPTSWPEYICISLINESLPYASGMSGLHIDTMTGAFTINRTLVDESNPVPEWFKSHNDVEHDDIWIWFDTHWYVSNYSDIVMICDPYGYGGSMNPLDCKHWYDIDWQLLDNVYLSECSADDVITASPTSSPTAAPTSQPTENERICLSRNGTVSSALCGLYVDNGVNRDEYGTFDFERVSTDLSDETEPLYIWYHDNGWWISPVNYLLKDEMDQKEIDVFGYCRGGERGIYPVCEECWVFFWDVHPLSIGWNAGKKIEDCSFELSTDLSVCSSSLLLVEYPSSLCINRVSDDHISNHHHRYDELDDVPTFVSLSQYIGEYNYVSDVIDETGAINSYYVDEESKFYMRHNKINNDWYIGMSSDPKHTDLLCRALDNDDGIPSVCVAWDNANHDVVYVDNMISIGQECIKNEEKKKGNGGKVAGTVIGILLGIVCCGVIIFLWLKCNRDKTHQPVASGQAENEMGTIATGGKVDTSVVPDDEQALGATKGQETYDMEALNARENDDDEDADPLTTE